MEQVNQVIKALNLDYFDRTFVSELLERKRLRNSDVLLAGLVVLFILNSVGWLRWFSQGIFVFLIPAAMTLTAYNAGSTATYGPLMCYWMVVAGLLRIEDELCSIPLLYSFEVTHTLSVVHTDRAVVPPQLPMGAASRGIVAAST